MRERERIQEDLKGFKRFKRIKDDLRRIHCDLGEREREDLEGFRTIYDDLGERERI